MDTNIFLEKVSSEPSEDTIKSILVTYMNYIKKHPEFNSSNGNYMYETLCVNDVKSELNNDMLKRFFDCDLVYNYFDNHNIDINSCKTSSEIKENVKVAADAIKGVLNAKRGVYTLDSNGLYGIANTEEINHELVLNVEGSNFAEVFLEVYNALYKSKIPFHIEFAYFDKISNGITNAIRIDCSNANLLSTLDIINNLSDDIKAKISTPGINVADINGWLGYTSFIRMDEDKKVETMSEYVGNVIYDSIKELCSSYMALDPSVQQIIGSMENSTDINLVNALEYMISKNSNYLDNLTVRVAGKLKQIGNLYTTLQTQTELKSLFGINIDSPVENNDAEQVIQVDTPIISVESEPIPLDTAENVVSVEPISPAESNDNLDNNVIKIEDAINNLESYPVPSPEGVNNNQENINDIQINQSAFVSDNSEIKTVEQANPNDVIVVPDTSLGETPLSTGESAFGMSGDNPIVPESIDNIVTSEEPVAIQEEQPTINEVSDGIKPVETVEAQVEEKVVPVEPVIEEEKQPAITEQRLDEQLMAVNNASMEGTGISRVQEIDEIFKPFARDLSPLEGQNNETDLSDGEVNDLVNALQEQAPISPELIQKYSEVTTNVDILRKYVTKSNGEKITVIDYLESNNVLETIPLDSTVYMADGSNLTGAEFISKYVIEYIVNNGVIPVDDIIQKYTNEIAKSRNVVQKKGLFDIFKK